MMLDYIAYSAARDHRDRSFSPPPFASSGNTSAASSSRSDASPA